MASSKAGVGFAIAGRLIGPDHPPYMIAEMSNNHLCDLDRALALVTAAKNAGADAVKLQTFTGNTMTLDCDKPEFWIEGGLWDGQRLHDLYESVHLPWEWHEAVFARGRELGITIFSSPFDVTAVDLLEELDAPAYKVASFEAVDPDLIKRVAQTGKPVIISTGMADLDEITEAVAAARAAGCEQLALLHCTSGYPTPFEDSNLRTIRDLGERFDVPVGLSDHTHGIAVPIAGVVLGACIVEKHYTLRRADGGPDAAFSLEPEEIAAMIEGCHTAWTALGTASYERKPSEKGSMVFRRSLYVVEDVAKGDAFSEKNVRSIRPGHGLKPKHLPEVLGRRASRDI